MKCMQKFKQDFCPAPLIFPHSCRWQHHRGGGFRSAVASSGTAYALQLTIYELLKS